MPTRTAKVSLNPELLKWARKTAGFGLAEIARVFRKSTDEIAAWEKGEGAPTIRQLEKLAKKVERPLSAFFLPQPPPEPALPRDFRVLPSRREGVFEHKTLVAFRQARSLLSETIELLELLDTRLSIQLPRFTLEDNPETKAATFRTHLGISIQTQLDWRDKYEALDFWRDALFDHGVLVFHFPMNAKDARGFSMEEKKLGIIGLSTKDDPVARCYSLFHEVCHLCLSKPGVSAGEAIALRRISNPDVELELFCDRFAAGFLLPLEDPLVKAELENTLDRHSGCDKSRTISVARKFKVSKYTVLFRVLDAGLISRSRCWETFRTWQNEDTPPPRGGGNYVATQISARGKRFVSLVFDALDNGKISLHEASDYLSLQPKHFEDARASASRDRL